MLSGEIRAGARLSLPEIASVLDVSATPVREALSQLEQGGVVVARPNRGFFVPETSAEEARQVYPVIATLEGMMVASTDYDRAALKRLRAAQRDFERARESAEIVRADLDFHACLTAPSDNALARRIVRELKCRVFFYELAHLESVAQRSGSQHRTIVSLLAKGEHDAAANEVRANWLQSLEYVQESIGSC